MLELLINLLKATMEKTNKHGKESINTLLLLAVLYLGYQDHLAIVRNTEQTTALAHALKWKLNINVNEQNSHPVNESKRYDASDISFAENNTETTKRKN